MRGRVDGRNALAVKLGKGKKNPYVAWVNKSECVESAESRFIV